MPARESKRQDGSDGFSDPLPDVPLVDHVGAPWVFSEHRGRPLLLILHRHLA
jgi:hypothetical protein